MSQLMATLTNSVSSHGNQPSESTLKRVKFSNEIRDLLSITHAIAKMKREISKHDTQMYNEMQKARPLGDRKRPLSHTDAELRLQRKTVEDKIIALFKPLKYPVRDGWVKFVETCTDGHAILQTNISELIDSMREIEQGYRTILEPLITLRKLRRAAVIANKLYMEQLTKIQKAYRSIDSVTH